MVATLLDRYYSQNCKAITFRKISNHTKYKLTNVPSHLHIFLHPFVLGETDIQKILPGVLSWGIGA